jgi:hypothetical protein
MHGEEPLVYSPWADSEQRAKVARAVAACPAQGIMAVHQRLRRFTDRDR